MAPVGWALPKAKDARESKQVGQGNGEGAGHLDEGREGELYAVADDQRFFFC